MKTYVKKVLPSKLIKIYINFGNFPIKNFFKQKHDKRVLISYITLPFRRNSLSHSNYYEVTSAAKIFDELGYNVDVIHFDGRIPNLEKYDIIYGFGDVFKKYFESGLSGKKTIYYGTGMHVCHQNTSSLRRIKDVFNKKGVWLAKSSRFVEKTWSHQTTLVDGIIALGNEACAETYRNHYDGIVISLPAPFFKTIDPYSILSNQNKDANKSYLWFGSSGLVHKGLDLCLDFFKNKPDLSLHICGKLDHEIEFVNLYKRELFDLPNIFVHGFVNIDSEKFKEILRACSFVIFPSCSEGGGVAVLTAIGNGGLIPIITRETSVSTGYEIVIEELTTSGVEKAVEYSQLLTDDEVIKIRKLNIEYVLREHSKAVYFNKLKRAIKEILYL